MGLDPDQLFFMIPFQKGIITFWKGIMLFLFAHLKFASDLCKAGPNFSVNTKNLRPVRSSLKYNNVESHLLAAAYRVSSPSERPGEVSIYLSLHLDTCNDVIVTALQSINRYQK